MKMPRLEIKGLLASALIAGTGWGLLSALLWPERALFLGGVAALSAVFLFEIVLRNFTCEGFIIGPVTFVLGLLNLPFSIVATVCLTSGAVGALGAWIIWQQARQ